MGHELQHELKRKTAAVRRRWVPVSINRRLVLDGLYFAKRVPLYPAERVIDLAEVAILRKHAAQRISWAAVFVKAYSIVAQQHPPLRQTYIRWPWPHFVEEPHSTAMVVVNRQFRNEDRICWGRIAQPEAKSLAEIQENLNAYQTQAVDRIFRQQVTLSKMPAPVRRALYWLNMNFGGRKRAKRLGTFTMSTLAGHGVENRGHQTFLTTSLTYGPLNERNRMNVTLLCDHRVVDGVNAARALADLEHVLNEQIAAELKSLRAIRKVA